MKHGVLVVGAGPTGLTAANYLVRNEVACEVIERRTGPVELSKGLSLSPATLGVLDELGCLDSVMAEGRKTDLFRIHFNGRVIGQVDFAALRCAYPFFLHVPQWITEAALRVRLESRGLSVAWSTELVGLHSDDAGVLAIMRTPFGIIERRYDAVLGADGVGSTVRELAGFTFFDGGDKEATRLGFQAHLCDAPLRSPFLGKCVSYLVDNEGFAVVLPLTDRLYRIVVGEPKGAGGPDLWPGERFEASLRRLGVNGLELGDPVWRSFATPRVQVVDNFSRGRIAVAGDVSTVSFIGGQGLNKGAQDACAFAKPIQSSWSGGQLSEHIRDYGASRSAATQAIARWTCELTELVTRRDRDPNGPMRSVVGPGGPAPRLVRWLAGLEIPPLSEATLALSRI